MNRRTHNARSIRLCREQSFAGDALLPPDEEPPLAAHLVTPRALYSHHGIYIGYGRVIHYAGLAYGFRRGPVADVSLTQFARGRDIRIRRDPPKFSSGEVVERARSRLGESRYRLLTNNCEHFCSWALRDECYSKQVEWLRAFQRAVWTSVRAVFDRAYRCKPVPTYRLTA